MKVEKLYWSSVLLHVTVPKWCSWNFILGGGVLIEFLSAFQFLLRSNSDSRHVDLRVFLHVLEA